MGPVLGLVAMAASALFVVYIVLSDRLWRRRRVHQLVERIKGRGPMLPPPPPKPRPADKGYAMARYLDTPAAPPPSRSRKDDHSNEPDFDVCADEAQQDERPPPERPAAPEEVEFRARVQDVQRGLQRALEFVAKKTGLPADDLEVDYQEWPFDGSGIPVVYTEYRNGEPLESMHWVLWEEAFPRAVPRKNVPKKTRHKPTEEQLLATMAPPAEAPPVHGAVADSFYSWWIWRPQNHSPPIALPNRVVRVSTKPEPVRTYFQDLREWANAYAQVMDLAQRGVLYISSREP